MFDIVQVVTNASLEGQIASARYLAQSGYAWLNRQSLQSDCVILFDFTRQSGPWTDKGHITYQYVPELREFIQAKTSHPAAASGNARILFYFKDRTRSLVVLEKLNFTLLGINDHGSEFVEGERLLVFTNSTLREQDWAS